MQKDEEASVAPSEGEAPVSKPTPENRESEKAPDFPEVFRPFDQYPLKWDPVSKDDWLYT